MSLSTVLSRDIVATRLIFNMMKRNKYEDYLKDAVVGDLKWSAVTNETSLSRRGWIMCDGRPLSRSNYPDLFAVINTTYGSGDGSTTFNLPDCKGRVLAAPGLPSGDTTASKTRVIGQPFGHERHTLTELQMPSHKHSGTTVEEVDTKESEDAAKTGIGSVTVSGSFPRKLTLDIGYTGGDQPFDISQPTIVIGNVFIYSGVHDHLEKDAVDVVGPDDTEYSA